MKKWITSNYHYMVPEVEESSNDLKYDFSDYLANVERGIRELGIEKATPVVLGPVSMARLATFKFDGAIDMQRFALLEKLLPIYKKLMGQLIAMGVKEIQVHEPALVFAEPNLVPLFLRTYENSDSSVLPSGQKGVLVNMVSFFEDVGEENYKWLIKAPGIHVISLDFTRGDNRALVKKHGFPKDKIIGAGVVDGRNVWKVDAVKVQDILNDLVAESSNIRIQPSSSLQFVPWDLDCEEALRNHTAGPVLAFSKQKLVEISAIAKNDKDFFEHAKSCWDEYRKAVSTDKIVADRVAALRPADFSRSEIFEARRKKQLPGLPLLPTTTIGSFPQTKEIRSLRNQYKRNKISKAEYEAKIDQQIALMIGIQEVRWCLAI